nr:protein phosphatase 1 regulatory subunit 12B [Hymenolepis microstoma]
MLACSSLNTANRRQQIESWEASEMNKEIVNPRPPERVNFPIDVQFHAACKNADLDEVKSLLANGVDINVTNVDGLTVLHQFLLSNNADVNAQDNEGWTPLHACASCAYPELAKLLLEHGANTGIVSFELELPLDVAQGKDMVALLKDWMQRQSVDEKAARNAEEQAMLKDAQEWLRTGNYPRVVDPRTGATALHIAAAKGYSDVLEILLKLPNIEVDATDVDGWTPLHAAAHWAKEKPLRLLASAGASFDIITLTNQTIYDVADRSVTMLLRQLRVEQQRAAAAAAEEKPVVAPPAVAVRRKASDEEEHQAPKPGHSIPSDETEVKVGDNAKPADPKVAKIDVQSEIQPSSSTTPIILEKKEEEEETEEAEENADDLLNKPQKDEVALRAKKLDEKEKEMFALLQKEEGKKQQQREASEVKSVPGRPHSPVIKVPEKVELPTLKEDSKPSEPEKTLEGSTSPRQPSPLSSTSIASAVLSSSQRNQVAEPTTTQDTANGVASNGVTGRSNVRKKDSTTIKRISAVLAPARSEETEAQRSSKARLVRSTRRSTQGIANDVLEEARRLSSTTVPPLVSTSVVPTTTTAIAVSTASIVTPAPVQGEGNTSKKLSFKSLIAKFEQLPTASLQLQPPSQSKNPPRQKSFASKVTLGYLSQPLSRPLRQAFVGKINHPGSNGIAYDNNCPPEEHVATTDALIETLAEKNETDNYVKPPREPRLSISLRSAIRSLAAQKPSVDHVTPGTATSVPTTHVSKAIITPTQPSTAPSTTHASDASQSSIIAHSRARRAAKDRVPTGKLDTNDVLAAAKQLEQSTVASVTDGTMPVTSILPSDPIPRPTTRALRSTILNTTSVTNTNNNNNGNEATVSNGNGHRRVSPAQFSNSSTTISKPADQRYNWRENLDYRMLYEEEKSEKEGLKRTLEQLSQEIHMLRSELAKLHVSNSNPTNATSPKSSVDSSASRPNTLEYYENQAKEIERLRADNARMADENKSLIRVISKLSARSST